MDDRLAIGGATDRRERTSVTLADLSMLVVGFALVFSLPRLHHLADRITIGSLPMPGWVATLFVIQEVAMKGGLILAPVIVARRARYGGLPRPADWLAILVGLPLLHEVIQRFGWVKRLARWYLVVFRSSLGYPVPFLPGSISVGHQIDSGYEGFPADFTPGDEGRLWGWFATILLIMLFTALGFGWKRIPGWAKTGFLSVAAFIWLAGVTYLLFHNLGRASEAISGWISLPSSITYQITLGLGKLPEGLLFGVPIVALLFDLRRGASRSWAWTGWVGTATGLLALSIDLVIRWYADMIYLTDTVALTRLTVDTLRLVAVGVTSWVTVKHVRWTGTASDES